MNRTKLLETDIWKKKYPIGMCSTQSVQVLVQLFDHGECDVPVLTEVPIRPQPGFRYFYEWTDWDKKSDWRVDGYSWRQNGRYKFAYKDVECDKIYFKLRVGECDVFTNEFSRTVIINPLVPNRVLVIYEGDNSVVVDLPHGNAKHPSKKSKPFYRTRPSLINAMKNLKNKLPVQIYSNLTLAAPKALDRHIVDAPRNIEQVRNARKFIPKEIRLTKKAINNLADLYYETEFIQHFQLFPNLKLICFLQTAVNNFKSLLLDESLSAQCLSYNTTLECGHFYLSVLAYQQTEFQESPDVPLLFMIHDKKFKSEQDFLFQQLTILIPELKNSQKTILITDKETAIVNAAKRHLPHIPRFRCWIHALKSIKSKLRSFGITDKQQLKEYKDDFISLLNQETLADYQSLLVEYMMKWNQVNVQNIFRFCHCLFHHNLIELLINFLN